MRQGEGRGGGSPESGILLTKSGGNQRIRHGRHRANSSRLKDNSFPWRRGGRRREVTGQMPSRRHRTVSGSVSETTRQIKVARLEHYRGREKSENKA